MTEETLRRSAVERAYLENADHVYRVAYAILRDPEAASDATHDTFARAYEHWERYDANRPVRAWLHGIVAHAALDAVRRRRVRERAVQVMGRVADLGENRFADDLSGDAARRQIVDQGLASLGPQARAAVVLRHYYGYDYAEIASFLRTSPGNVGSVLSRAHADLRRVLAAQSTTASGDERTTNRRVAGAPGAAQDRTDR
jgi:RNA polymerase sigma-70 factor (ECF subfamily)